MAKAPIWNGSDGEGRKLGERSGLDMHKVCFLFLLTSALKTPVVQAVNDVRLVLQASREPVVPERRC